MRWDAEGCWLHHVKMLAHLSQSLSGAVYRISLLFLQLHDDSAITPYGKVAACKVRSLPKKYLGETLLVCLSLGLAFCKV